jgi:hypothetical protein
LLRKNIFNDIFHSTVRKTLFSTIAKGIESIAMRTYGGVEGTVFNFKHSIGQGNL